MSGEDVLSSCVVEPANWHTEIAWAGGLFEGEGCIYVAKDRQKNRKKWGFSRGMALSMTDEDSVRRFGRAMGVGGIDLVHDRRTTPHQPLWRWHVESFENIQACIALLWGGLGRRRRARAKEVLEILKTETVSKQDVIRLATAARMRKQGYIK